MSITSVPESSIHDFFLFTKNGICVLHLKYENYINDKTYAKLIIVIKNISTTLLQNCKDNQEFNFHKIKTNKLLINILIKNGLAFIGVFKSSCNTSFTRIILAHMFIALLNFKGDTIEKLTSLANEPVDFNKDHFETLQSFLNKNKNELKEFKTTDLFELMIYEQFFLKYIGLHFNKIFNKLFKPEEMYQTYNKFKNMYVVDVSTGTILIDWLKIKQASKNVKYYNNEKLWFEIIHHSRQMMESYKREHKLSFSMTDIPFRFVKFECTSTFPRMTFMTKFLPLLKGLAVVHVYSKKKLSRMPENPEQQIVKGYKEIDLLYGCDIKANASLDFRYSTPEMLRQIEQFLIEFLISLRNTDVFRDPHFNRELKYFDYSIITAINSVPSDNSNSTIENMITKINMKLKEMYLASKSSSNNNTNGNNNANHINPYTRTISINSKYFGEAEKMEQLLIIKQNDILRDLFGENKQTENINEDDNDNDNKSQMNNNKDVNYNNNNNNNKNIKINNNGGACSSTDNNCGYNSEEANDADNESSSEMTIPLSKVEHIKGSNQNENVTILQSRDVSCISIFDKTPKLQKKKTVSTNKEVQLDKLLDMTDTLNEIVDSDIAMTTTNNVPPSNNNKLGIKIPNPKENKHITTTATNKKEQHHKLILLDEQNQQQNSQENTARNDDEPKKI